MSRAVVGLDGGLESSSFSGFGGVRDPRNSVQACGEEALSAIAPWLETWGLACTLTFVPGPFTASSNPVRAPNLSSRMCAICYVSLGSV